MSTGRSEILGAIRGALTDVPDGEPAAWGRDADPDPAATYRRTVQEPATQTVDRFAERCAEYRATVTRCAGDDAAVRDAVAAACARNGASVLAVPDDLPPAWIPEGLAEVRADAPPLTLDRLDGCDGALTGCAAAIAETGTIALDGGPGQGRRALTLIPDLHICVVATDAVVASVPEAITRLRESVLRRGAAIVLVSGPSATSDIELERVEGVHGPRTLEVILAGSGA